MRTNKGDVVWVRFTHTTGSEQKGERPAVVVGTTGDTALVVPLTTREKKGLPTHWKFYIPGHGPQTACTEQVQGIPTNRIGNYMARISGSDQQSIHAALAVAVSGLDTDEEPEYRRGDVVRVDTGKGSDFALVIQNDRGNRYAPTTIVFPLAIERLPSGPQVRVKGQTMTAKVARVKTVDKRRISETICHIGDDELESVSAAFLKLVS